MKPSELHNKSRQELQTLEKELREKLLKLNFEKADRKLKDLSQLGQTKRDIARVMTVLKSAK